MSKSLLPFWAYPAHWGLKGKSKKLAEIDFYSTNEFEAATSRADLIDDDVERTRTKLSILRTYSKITELEYELGLVELNMPFSTNEEKSKAILRIRLKYNDLEPKEYEQASIELIEDETQKQIATVEYLFKYHEISESERTKQICDLEGKPWWLLNAEFDADEERIIVNMDYNETYAQMLIEAGHPGNNIEEVMEFHLKDFGRRLATGDSSDNSDLLQEIDDPKLNRGISNGDGTVTYE